MQEYLKSKAANQQLYGKLCNRGLVWQDREGSPGEPSCSRCWTWRRRLISADP